MARIISVSTAPYDGWDAPSTLASLSACGVTHVEPAFIVGYTDPFDETAFSPASARQYAGWLAASGLRCHAVSSHIDLGGGDAVDAFRRRMDFAQALGAAIVNTNAALRANETAFRRNVASLVRHAETLDITIGLENPGDGRPNLIDLASDGVALVERLASPRVRLNYDPGNTVSHRPDVDPVADALLALRAAGHLHLKSVRRTDEGWRHVPFGDGDVDHAPLLAALRDGAPDLPVSIEMPLRVRRGTDAQPWRRVERLTLPAIEAAVRQSLEALYAGLGEGESGPL